jgi:hypothetical protein
MRRVAPPASNPPQEHPFAAEVAPEPFFTLIDAARANDIQAGVHDQAMFVSISKSALMDWHCISTIALCEIDGRFVLFTLIPIR